jgi:hypothetical protein
VQRADLAFPNGEHHLPISSFGTEQASEHNLCVVCVCVFLFMLRHLFVGRWIERSAVLLCVRVCLSLHHLPISSFGTEQVSEEDGA